MAVDLLVIWLVAAGVMGLMWMLPAARRNTGWADVAFAGLMVAAALYAGTLGEGSAIPRLLVAMMGGLWAARLCLHRLHRLLGGPEDARYRKLRRLWLKTPGRPALLFQGRAILVVLFSVPLLAAAANPRPGLYAVVAVAIWLVAVGGETLADLQLWRFRSRPGNRNRTCREGLWGHSRHPNYFFGWLHWWAYVVLAIGSPLAWLALTGPVLMALLAYPLGGIRRIETQARSHRRDYRHYQKEVPRCIPHPRGRATQQIRRDLPR